MVHTHQLSSHGCSSTGQDASTYTLAQLLVSDGTHTSPCMKVKLGRAAAASQDDSHQAMYGIENYHLAHSIPSEIVTQHEAPTVGLPCWLEVCIKRRDCGLEAPVTRGCVSLRLLSLRAYCVLRAPAASTGARGDTDHLGGQGSTPLGHTERCTTGRHHAPHPV